MGNKIATKYEYGDMPTQAQVGDRVRLKPEKIDEYNRTCIAAGFGSVDFSSPRTVIRDDPFCPGGGRRLFVEEAPFAFSSRDVELAWDGDARRTELRSRGWKV